MEMVFNVEVPKCSQLLGTPIRLGGVRVGTVVAYTTTEHLSARPGMEIVSVTVTIDEPVPAVLQPLERK